MQPQQTYFSGSYLPSDVEMLLDIVPIATVESTNTTEKEQLIQSGQRHYSDMLTLESPPSPTHEQLYQQALNNGKQRMAEEIANLAFSLKAIFQNVVTSDKPLILISLARAGLPVGVLLQRAFADNFSSYNLPSVHFGISIIRDRGLDDVAMAQIFARYPDSPLVFVDGWTGKGAIYGELERSLQPFNDPTSPHFLQIFHQGQGVIPLVTLADPAGVAWLSESDEDWLMPASLLNSTVSGLISRTLYTPPDKGLHRCVFYDYLAGYDHSLDFVEIIDNLRKSATPTPLTPEPIPRFATEPVILAIAQQFDIPNFNRIKPTIAEATRAVLRRDPEAVLLQHKGDPDTVLLEYLCTQKNVAIKYMGATIRPYRAITIIKNRQTEI